MPTQALPPPESSSIAASKLERRRPRPSLAHGGIAGVSAMALGVSVALAPQASSVFWIAAPALIAGFCAGLLCARLRRRSNSAHLHGSPQSTTLAQGEFVVGFVRFLAWALRREGTKTQGLQDLVLAFQPESQPILCEDIRLPILRGVRTVAALRRLAPVKLEWDLHLDAVRCWHRGFDRVVANILEGALDGAPLTDILRVRAHVTPGPDEPMIELAFSCEAIPILSSNDRFYCARRLVEASGGTLRCEVERSGKLIVRIVLKAAWSSPLDDVQLPDSLAAGGPALPQTESKSATRLETLIVVDDDDRSRLAWELQTTDAQVFSYPNPTFLLKELGALKRSHGRDFIFVLGQDYRDDDLKGTDIAGRLRQEFPRALILVAFDALTKLPPATQDIDGVIPKVPTTFEQLRGPATAKLSA